MNAKKKKNFVCSQCNKSFIDNAHLKDHEVGRGWTSDSVGEAHGNEAVRVRAVQQAICAQWLTPRSCSQSYGFSCSAFRDM